MSGETYSGSTFMSVPIEPSMVMPVCRPKVTSVLYPSGFSLKYWSILGCLAYYNRSAALEISATVLTTDIRALSAISSLKFCKSLSLRSSNSSTSSFIQGASSLGVLVS